jgi:hypothetical protein
LAGGYWRFNPVQTSWFDGAMYLFLVLALLGWAGAVARTAGWRDRLRRRPRQTPRQENAG